MSANSKNKILLIAVIILLLTNIAMLFFFLYNRGPEKKGGHGGREAMMTEFLQKDIGFNDQQIQQYDSLSKQHREKMKAMFDEVGKNKEAQLKQLGTEGFSDSAINKIAEQSADKQKLLEISMFLHLREIRQLCTPVQQPKFDSLIYKVLARRNDARKKPADNK